MVMGGISQGLVGGLYRQCELSYSWEGYTDLGISEGPVGPSLPAEQEEDKEEGQEDIDHDDQRKYRI
jgi:hypothetical protein